MGGRCGDVEPKPTGDTENANGDKAIHGENETMLVLSDTQQDSSSSLSSITEMHTIPDSNITIEITKRSPKSGESVSDGILI